MSAQLFEDARHPVAGFVEHLHADLDDLRDVGVWSMPRETLAATLVSLTRARARLAELEMRVLTVADRYDVGHDVAANDTPAWWAEQTRVTRAEAHRALRLARSLDSRHEQVRDGMADGRLVPEQAAVICEAVDALPHDLLDAELVERAEAHLVGLAAEHDSKSLRVLGRRLLDVLAPEVAEEHERRLLESEERQAREAAALTLVDDGHGKCHGRFVLPALHGEILRKSLLAIAAPRRADRGSDTDPEPRRGAVPDSATDVGSRVSSSLRWGRAFMEYIERYPAERIPHAGGVAATLVVTVGHRQLVDGLGSAALDTGGVISAGEARRLACEAGILPAVLGGASQVLDLGRRRRFHTEPQRRALALRDGGCTAEGCDWPPGMCHAHHDVPWSRGGPTDLTHGRLLCPRHHARAHDPAYTMQRRGDGTVTFHRRT